MEHDNHLEIQKTEFKFDNFRRLNLIYPEITGLRRLIKRRFFEVDIQFELDSNNTPQNVRKSEFVNKLPRMVFQKNKFKKTNKTEFINESKKLIESFTKWKHYKKGENYINKRFFKTINFAYHPEYFLKGNDFEINPDKRPYFKEKNDEYEWIINCKYGCDGTMNLLSVVEKNGELTNIELIGISGKISNESAIQGLKSLGNLEPAIKNGKKVRTQIDLLIYI
ncbi:energy transducer TonB [Polaribacter sp. KT 15]|uniref:energy transducer TonB n=1 Tax=Polaribacter sp. KT 15 TaxID=1896175 RepID=UPI00090A966F|nr:energy transducer TonB [Polaribacter sp. KT 15]SHM83434.1 hypothetical protein SAMN05720268_0848 [Polaribacter sp. KT 15]